MASLNVGKYLKSLNQEKLKGKTRETLIPQLTETSTVNSRNLTGNYFCEKSGFD